MTTAGDVDLETGLRRVLTGYRAAAVLWMAILAVAGGVPAGLGAGVTTAAMLGLAAAWALLTGLLAESRPHVLRHPVFLVLDLGVAAVVLLSPLLIARGGGMSGVLVTSIAGGYPFSAVLLAAWARGLPAGLAAAGILSVTSGWLRQYTIRGAGLDEALPTVLVFVAGALVTAWAVGLLRRQDVDRRAALLALAEERVEAARARERAETAAHLHDSVLQTLALIQRSADEPAAVRALAREQERDLRGWLSGQTPAEGAAAALLQARCAEIERDHGVTVELVVRGDRGVDEALTALVGAAAEAVRNTARHSGADTVSVYAEFDGAPAVFVRDRGSGFDPEAVPADRRGIAESVRGRLDRHGGRAILHTAPGQGTEWELRLGEEDA